MLQIGLEKAPRRSGDVGSFTQLQSRGLGNGHDSVNVQFAKDLPSLQITICFVNHFLYNLS